MVIKIRVVELILPDDVSLALSQLRMSLLLSLKKLILLNLEILQNKSADVDEINHFLEDYNMKSEELQTDIILLDNYKRQGLVNEDVVTSLLIKKRLDRLKQLSDLVVVFLEEKEVQKQTSFNQSLKFSTHGNLIP